MSYAPRHAVINLIGDCPEFPAICLGRIGGGRDAWECLGRIGEDAPDLTDHAPDETISVLDYLDHISSRSPKPMHTSP